MICVQMVSVQHLNNSDNHYDYHLGEGLPHTMANLSQVPLLKIFKLSVGLRLMFEDPIFHSYLKDLFSLSRQE